jgi:hypothetical protein
VDFVIVSGVSGAGRSGENGGMRDLIAPNSPVEYQLNRQGDLSKRQKQLLMTQSLFSGFVIAFSILYVYAFLRSVPIDSYYALVFIILPGVLVISKVREIIQTERQRKNPVLKLEGLLKAVPIKNRYRGVTRTHAFLFIVNGKRFSVHQDDFYEFDSVKEVRLYYLVPNRFLFCDPKKGN